MAQAAGEMATKYPVNGSFIHWAHRFIDPAAGVACGWNYAYACIAFACADITAVIGLWQYWCVFVNQRCDLFLIKVSSRLPDTNPAIWVSFCLVIFFCLNAFAVKVCRDLHISFSLN